MSNRPRQKGTAWESELLPLLRFHWRRPGIDRAPLKGKDDAGDFIGVPFLHEAKHVKVPRFLDWARKARAKALTRPWVILWKGDGRRDEPLAVMPLWLYWRLVDPATAPSPRHEDRDTVS